MRGSEQPAAFHGIGPLARQVPKRDAKVILLSVSPERVPPLILVLVTRFRSAAVV